MTYQANRQALTTFALRFFSRWQKEAEERQLPDAQRPRIDTLRIVLIFLSYVTIGDAEFLLACIQGWLVDECLF